MLKKIVHDQITRHVRPKLGRIAVKQPQVAMYKNILGKEVKESDTLQWGKRAYMSDRGSNTLLLRNDFYNFDHVIPLARLSANNSGALNDLSIPVGTNVEYSIEVYSTLVTGNNPNFPIEVGGGSKASVYMRIPDNRPDATADHRVVEVARNISSGTVSLNIPLATWVTVFIYLYSVSDNTYISAFNGLLSYIDSWRMPDITPPDTPTWADTPLTTSSDPISGQSYVKIYWNYDVEAHGNGIYIYEEEDTGFDVANQNLTDDVNGIFISANTSNAFNDFPAGTSIRPNSDYNYTPAGTQLVKANLITNNVFTSTTGPNTWTGWTVTRSDTDSASVYPYHGSFYTEGVSVFSSVTPDDTDYDVYMTHNSKISVSTANRYQIMLTYKTGSVSTSVSGLQLKYFDGGQVPCSTAYQITPVLSTRNWTTLKIPIYGRNDDVSSAIDRVTAYAFKLPSDCAYIQPVMYFHYDTSTPSRFYMDSMKLGIWDKYDIFSTAASDRVLVKLSENLISSDTPYCDFFCHYNNTVNDTIRSVNGTLEGSGTVYYNNELFSDFGTSLCLNAPFVNDIKNGHFSQNWTHWGTNKISATLSTSTYLFGATSARITSIDAEGYISQSVSLVNDSAKGFAFYVKPIQGDGVRVVGMLSGATQFDYSQHYSTTGWQRMLFSITSVDALQVYPYYSTSTFRKDNGFYLDGVLLHHTTMDKHFATFPPYCTDHIDGTTVKEATYVAYNDTLIDTAQGTIEIWARPQGGWQDNTTLNQTHITLFTWIHTSVGYNEYWIVGNDNSNWFWLMSDDVAGARLKWFYATPHPKYEPGDLVHVVCTWADGHAQFYFNGVKHTSAKDNVGDATSDAVYMPHHSALPHLRVGYFMQEPSDSLYGYLDAFRIESCHYSEERVLRNYKARAVGIRA